MSNIIEKLEKEQLRLDIPAFDSGDTVIVHVKIKEGEKERIQTFRGDVIAFHNNGISTTFMVRRIGADGIGVEKIFPYYSPNVADVKLVKTGDVCRAKLFYIRERVGKAARIKEKILTKEQKLEKQGKKKTGNSKS